MIGDNRPISLQVVGDGGSATSRQAESLGLIVTELVMNALKHAFPLTRSEEFGSSPFLVGSVRRPDDDPRPHVRVSEGVLNGNDTLFFASDALAAWLLRRAEKGEPAWEWISAGIQTPQDFELLVAQAREEGTRNDDMTLVRLARRAAPKNGT